MTELQLLLTDNTVPINFSLIGQIPLLRDLLNGQGAWTGTVQAEYENSVSTGLYADLADVAGFIAHSFIATDEEQKQARTIRRDIAKPDEPFPRSFGEAESIAVIRNRGLQAAFLTDDVGAAVYVELRELGLKIITTAELLALAVNLGSIAEDTGRDYVLSLSRQGRGVCLGDFEESLGY